MNILFLTNEKADNIEDIVDLIKLYGDSVVLHSKYVDLNLIRNKKIDYILSDRYPLIIDSIVLDYMNGRAINTHPSLLPLNRGHQPNFFSILYHTKKGVSIHKIDEGIDTGDIIIQRELSYSDYDTLRTSYSIFRKSIISLLYENWYDILNENIKSEPQESKGNINYKHDFENLFINFPKGWDTSIKEIQDFAKYQKNII